MKQIVITGLLFLFSVAAMGQQRDRAVEENIESRRIAYLTQSLQLTPSEAQDFWPLYNAYKKEQKALKEKHKDKAESKTKSLDTIFDQDAEYLALKKEYSYKIEKVIGTERTIKLLRSDRKFKEKLVRGLKEKRSRNRSGR